MTVKQMILYMIGKQLADVLTRCSSHPQGKSEARCQDIHLSIVTHSRIHVTRDCALMSGHVSLSVIGDKCIF